ncbi:kinase-like domain-containing protein [Gigaspora rosea]|uniref:Kinase-like domain-containing protein n=1 Tax=Gigaspora rosea TaxID=44941 RepID=A0A397UL58_9GLOM|nr:kinase-like domain-containing protein [Gigaspora rosea]
MTWKDKITALFNISMGLNTLHKSQLIHHDFHSGNLLFLRDVGGKFLNISDLGQCKRDGQNELNAVIGILPYIGPEVLYEKKYTKASDIYSFGIVVYEIITGFRPHSDLMHDHHLAIEIMNGLRPKIPTSTPKLLAKLIIQCWDARPNKRPTSNELYLTIKRLYDEVMENKQTEFVEQIKKAEKAEENSTDSLQINASKMPHYKTHPGAIYTSRLLDFSTLPPPVNAPDFEILRL